MKKPWIFLAVFAVLPVTFAACGGGGGKSVDSPKSAALDACSPSSGPVGTKVVCTAKGMTEDATLFFGGKPVEFIFNAEDEVVSFTVPPMLPGAKNVYAQEGDGDTHPIGAFEVAGPSTASTGGEVTPTEATPPAPTEDGEVITPSGSGGTTTGEEAGGTTGETTGGGTGTGGTGGTPEPAPLNATLTAQKMFDTRLGLVKLTWSVTAGEEISELYVYGPFYRIDADEAAANPCGKIEDAYGKRHLLVHSDGNDLNDGSPNFLTWNKYMGSAQKCTGGSNCHGYTAPTTLRDPDGGTFKTRNLYADLQLNPNLQYEMNPTPQLYPYLIFSDSPPMCRMDLKNAAAFVKSGEVYTRLLTRAPFTLYVKTVSGETKKVTTSVAELPQANITATAEVMNDEPKVKFTANYGYALLPVNAPAGCTKTAGTYNAKGNGMVEAKCPLAKSQQYAVSAVGIGLLGADSATFKVESGNVQTELKPTTLSDSGGNALCDAGNSNWWKNCNKGGNLMLYGYATRTWTVSERNGSSWTPIGSAKEVPWFKGMEIKAYKYDGSSCGTSGFKEISDLSSLPSRVSVGIDGRLLLQATLPRNHDCTRYELETKDLDGTWNAKKTVEAPYEASFDLSNTSGSYSYGCMIDDCDAWADGDCCDAGDCGACPSNTVSDCTGHTTNGAFNWSGRHIKGVTSTCGGSFSAQPSGGNYDVQSGNWTNSVSGTKMDCEVEATTWDGQTIQRTFSVYEWHDNC